MKVLSLFAIVVSVLTLYQSIGLSNRILFLESSSQIDILDDSINNALNSPELCFNMLGGNDIGPNKELILGNPVKPKEVFLEQGKRFKGFYVKSVNFGNIKSDESNSLTKNGTLTVVLKFYDNVSDQEIKLKYNLTVNLVMVDSNKVESCNKYF